LIKEDKFMFIAIDIGNSSITIGSAVDAVWQEHRFTSDKNQSLEHYANHFKGLRKSLGNEPIQGIVISSVVPALTNIIREAAGYAFDTQPYVFDKQWFNKLPVIPLNPDEIGTDLVANTLAGWERFKTSFLVVDFGTALTYTFVNKQGHIEGVAIAPGIETALNSLVTKAAQLPEISLDLPVYALGTNTVEAMQAGILWGYVGQVQYMVQKIKEQYNPTYTIATGGLSHVLDPLESTFDAIDRHLTIKGLKCFYEIASS
jgi:type III pantothenate kinase